jgi:hypothetical protein
MSCGAYFDFGRAPRHPDLELFFRRIDPEQLRRRHHQLIPSCRVLLALLHLGKDSLSVIAHSKRNPLADDRLQRFPHFLCVRWLIPQVLTTGDIQVYYLKGLKRLAVGTVGLGTKIEVGGSPPSRSRNFPCSISLATERCKHERWVRHTDPRQKCEEEDETPPRVFASRLFFGRPPDLPQRTSCSWEYFSPVAFPPSFPLQAGQTSIAFGCIRQRNPNIAPYLFIRFSILRSTLAGTRIIQYRRMYFLWGTAQGGWACRFSRQVRQQRFCCTGQRYQQGDYRDDETRLHSTYPFGTKSPISSVTIANGFAGESSTVRPADIAHLHSAFFSASLATAACR